MQDSEGKRGETQEAKWMWKSGMRQQLHQHQYSWKIDGFQEGLLPLEYSAGEQEAMNSGSTT